MEGVTIVETIYEYASLIPIEWVFIMVGICLSICVLGGFTVHFDTVQKILTCSIVVAIIGMIVCGIGAIIKTDEVIGERYKVSISEDVSLVEFYKNYNVIDSNGTIFTVKEKSDK